MHTAAAASVAATAAPTRVAALQAAADNSAATAAPPGTAATAATAPHLPFRIGHGYDMHRLSMDPKIITGQRLLLFLLFLLLLPLLLLLLLPCCHVSSCGMALPPLLHA